MLAGVHQDSDPDGDALTATLAIAPSHGSVTVGPDGSFVYSYTGTLPPPLSDTFGYRLADGFGGTAQATATILLNGAAAGARPTAVTSFSAVDASTAAGAASVSRVQLSWLASSDDVQVLGYNVYRNSALLAFVPSPAAPGTTVLYTDTAVSRTGVRLPNHRADAANESPVGGAHRVGGGLAAAQHPDGLGARHGHALAGDRLRRLPLRRRWRLTLFGAADVVVTELNEDTTDVAPRRIEARRRYAVCCSASRW